MINTYIKKVNDRELLLNIELCNFGIVPKVYSFRRIIEMISDKWPVVLSELDNISPYLDKIKDLIRELHSHNIYHGDIHEGNIVLNQEGDIRLIDLECCTDIRTIVG